MCGTWGVHSHFLSIPNLTARKASLRSKLGPLDCFLAYFMHTLKIYLSKKTESECVAIFVSHFVVKEPVSGGFDVSWIVTSDVSVVFVYKALSSDGSTNRYVTVDTGSRRVMDVDTQERECLQHCTRAEVFPCREVL